MGTVTKTDVEKAFVLYDKGVRSKKAPGEPTKWRVRNPENGDFYPAKKIITLAYDLAGVEFKKPWKPKREQFKNDFEFINFKRTQIPWEKVR